MKFVSSRELSTKPSKIYEDLAKTGKIVVNFNGKPRAIMVGIDEENFEGMWAAITKALAEYALSDIRATAREKDLDSMRSDEIDGIIRKTRRERKK